MTRRPGAALALPMLVWPMLVWPIRVEAQPAAFAEGFRTFAAAVEGTFGDEGALLNAALDTMANALAEWDRTIAEAETKASTAARGSPSGFDVDERLELGRMHAERGHLDEALQHLDAAAGLAPRNGDVQLLRGLILSLLNRQAEATDAFQTAWAIDPGDPVKSYHALRRAAAAGDLDTVARTRAALAAAYTAQAGKGVKTHPLEFADLSPLQQSPTDAPVVPLHAYAPGYRLLLRGDLDGAVAALRTAAAADPLVADIAVQSPSYRQAVTALREGRLRHARELLDVPDRPGASSQVHRVLGLVFWAGSSHDASVERFEAAVRATPHDERSRLALARVLELAGGGDQAQRVLEDVIRILPESALAHWWLGRTHERSGRLDEARREYAHAAAAVVNGARELVAGVGRLAAGAADLSAAVAAFSNGVDRRLNDPAMHLYLAEALQQQDRGDEAFAEFVAAALLDPSEPRAHQGIGEIHLDAGRYVDAAAALRAALDLSPSLTPARYALATALARQGDRQGAAREFERVEQEQRSAIADRRRTLSLDVLKESASHHAAEGRTERAVELWKQVVERDPGDPGNHLALAAALMVIGRVDAAIEQYESALGNGADPSVYRELAQLYAKAGRSADAARARILVEQATPADAGVRDSSR